MSGGSSGAMNFKSSAMTTIGHAIITTHYHSRFFDHVGTRAQPHSDVAKMSTSFSTVFPEKKGPGNEAATRVSNKSFPSCFEPHYESEAKYKALHAYE